MQTNSLINSIHGHWGGNQTRKGRNETKHPIEEGNKLPQQIAAEIKRDNNALAILTNAATDTVNQLIQCHTQTTHGVINKGKNQLNMFARNSENKVDDPFVTAQSEINTATTE
jgi:hypothetical protein